MCRSINKMINDLSAYKSSSGKNFERLLVSYNSCVSGFHLSLESSSWFRLADSEHAIQLPSGFSKAATFFSLCRIVFSLHDRINNYMGLEGADCYELFVGTELISCLQRDTHLLAKY